MKQMDTVYHREYGKGIVINKTLKGKDYLVMCRFGDTMDWSLESKIVRGEGDISLDKDKGARAPIDDLKSSIEGILFGDG